MTHNLSVFQTVAQCDEFLAANLENLENLNYSKTTLSHRLATGVEEADQISAELQASEAALQMMNNLLPSLPDGQQRNDLLDEINDTENDIIRLTSRLENNGIVSYAMRQVDMEFILVKQAANEDIHAQVVARKTELTSATAA
jgi:hypothetical protein